MKVHPRQLTAICAVLVLLISSCGYTTKTNLPEHIKSVHVDKVRNAIDISSEVSSNTPFQTYRPGLEIELRNALIERFIFDGHLKVVPKDRSDAVLKAVLLSFDRGPVRYNADDSIQEFRVYVKASIEFRDRLSDEIIWSRASLAGDSSYFLSGDEATSEDVAVEEALDDLVRHVVEKILEVW